MDGERSKKGARRKRRRLGKIKQWMKKRRVGWEGKIDRKKAKE